MLGKLRVTQNLEISTWSNDILGKGSIFCRICVCLGISSLFPDFRSSIVSANGLFYNSYGFFHDIKNVSLLAMHEFRMSIEFSYR